MSELKYGIGWGLIYAAASIASDVPTWELLAVIVLVATGLPIILRALVEFNK